MTSVTSIENLAQHASETVELAGWMHSKTGKGKLQFVHMRDGTELCHRHDVANTLRHVANTLVTRYQHVTNTLRTHYLN